MLSKQSVQILILFLVLVCNNFFIVFLYDLQSFYKKHFETEEDRVNELFLKADSKGVVMKKW